ncbi:MDR family MFS transporter [Brevundimonas sp.]|uniref:MDR family MFS transporter n=1 Tax=Brevundimonas sp. TaxID=1871086 RepID=UPI0028A1D453|nr:MDR family MFS transporter [Brevundimonas sp.]
MTSSTIAPEKAGLGAWLAVAAGTIGALMATLDISIVNSSLPTIQGEIGASGSEGTWIATAYLVAEIVVIPLAAWLQRVIGLRSLLLIAVSFFISFSALCGLSDTLPVMIAGRIGQGFAGGLLIPTAMTIIATRLPPSQQPVGTAAFGAVAILGPVIGPLLGGWLTENLSWHYNFFINVPIGLSLILLLLVGLPHEKPDLKQLRGADWWGIAGLALGLGCMTVVLEEGQSEQWFASAEIVCLTVFSILGFIMVAIGQRFAPRPVIKLSLLLNRGFGAVFVTSLALGAVLYGVTFVIPQFLAAIAGYDAQQAGRVVAISGIPSLMLMAFVPFLIRKLDVRIAVGFGMTVLAISCFIDTSLTADTTGAGFVVSQLMRGGGQILAMIFLNQAAISAVSPADAADASGLFNVARNLGGSIGLSLLGTLQAQRLWFHERMIEQSVSANSLSGQDFIAAQAAAYGGGADAQGGALSQLVQMMSQQALVMTYSDMFFAVGAGIVLVLPLVFMLRPLRAGQTMAL